MCQPGSEISPTAGFSEAGQSGISSADPGPPPQKCKRESRAGKGGRLETVVFYSFVAVYGENHGSNVCSPSLMVHTIHDSGLYKPPTGAE